MARDQVTMEQFLRLSKRLDEFAQRVNGEVVLKVFPVGSLFLSLAEENPAAYLGGQWERYAEGCCLVGVDPDDADFSQAGQKTGAKTVALTEAQNGAHTHAQNAHNHTQNAHNHTQNAHYHTFSNGNIAGSDLAIPSSLGSWTGYWAFNGTQTTNRTNDATATNNAATATNNAATATNQGSGSGAPHNNIQPSVPVYIWVRVA